MRFQHGRNPYFRGSSRQGTSQDGTRKDQGSQRIENPDKNQRCRKFSRICKLLSKIYPQLQPYSKTPERTEGQERVEMGEGTSRGI